MKSIKLLTASLILMAATSSSAFKCWSWKFGCGKGTPKAISACLASHVGLPKDGENYFRKLHGFMKAHPKCHRKAKGQEEDVCIDFTEDFLSKIMKLIKKDLKEKVRDVQKWTLGDSIDIYGQCLHSLKGKHEDKEFLRKAAEKFLKAKKLVTSVHDVRMVSSSSQNIDKLIILLEHINRKGGLPENAEANHFLFREYTMQKAHHHRRSF